MDQDSGKVVISLCMGSACHQFGVYGVLPVLRELLREAGVEDQVVLKGAFCLGPCTKGIVLQAGKKQITGINPETIRKKFYSQLLPAIRKQSGGLHEQPE